MQAARVGCERLFHKDVDTLADCVFDVQRPDIGASSAHGDIAGPENVDGLLVRLETDKLAVIGNINLIWKFFLQSLI